MSTSRSFFLRSFALLAVLFGSGQLVACGAVDPNSARDGGAPGPAAETGIAPAADAASSTSALCSATARVVATAPGTIAQVEILDGAALFTASTHDATALTMVDVASGAASVLAKGLQLRLVGIDGDSIVWTVGLERALHRGHLEGGDDDLGVKLADYEGSFTADLLGVSGGSILWADGRRGMSTFFSLPLAGGAPTPHVLPAGGPSPDVWIAADGSMLWSNGSGVWRGSVPDGAHPTHLGSSGAPIAARAGVVYVARASGDDLAVAAIDARGVGKTLGTVSGRPSSACAKPGKYGLGTILVGSDDRLYGRTWTDCMDGGGRVEEIARFDSGATKPTELAAFKTRSLATEVPMAVDASCLYWVENDGTTATLKTIAR